MICGLDFGTSNCSLGYFQGARPVLAKIGAHGPYMPSAVYVRRPDDWASQRTREGTNESRQTVLNALRRSPEVLFGDDAVAEYIASPEEGFFFTSPKLFLGSSVEESHLDLFSRLIALMLQEVRKRGEGEAGHALKQVVLGHPVVYSRSQGRAGVGQALSIMERCARDAGFAEVAFLPEPLAAALDYEQTVREEEVVLIVDVGGGTTDCAVVRVGSGRRARANRSDDVLAFAGERVGGALMDVHVAWQSLMPLFGRNASLRGGLPVPAPLLMDAISVTDIPRQERFRAAGGQIGKLVEECLEPQTLERLQILWERRLQHRLVQDAEQAKIGLSDQAVAEVVLDYIESGLAARIGREDLRAAIENDALAMASVAREAVRAAATNVDKVFITGGASRSPVVVAAIQAALGDTMEIVRGNDFGSVTEGLTQHAKTVFGSRAARPLGGRC